MYPYLRPSFKVPWTLVQKTRYYRSETPLLATPRVLTDSPNFGRKEKRRNVIMSKSKKVENKNGTNVEMLNAYKHQHMIVRNFNALTLTRTFSHSLLFLFSTFSFFGIFMFRHFYFRPKLGLPFDGSNCSRSEMQPVPGTGRSRNFFYFFLDFWSFLQKSRVEILCFACQTSSLHVSDKVY